MKIVILNDTDPYYNMATDEYFLTIKKIPLITLWRNDNCIVIGRNQNTFKEINQKFVKEHNIKVVRRISGGGAVFHDLGNVNFSFFMPMETNNVFNFKKFLLPIQLALQKLDLNAEISGRNDMLLDGKKISGNAQYIQNNYVLHHGTILFSVNTSFAMQSLNPNQLKLNAKGIDSVKMRITNIKENLNDKHKNLDVVSFMSFLFKNLKEQNSELTEYFLTDEDKQQIQKLRDEKFATFEHNFGKNPQAQIFREKYINEFGYIEIYIDTNNSIINNLHIYGDFFSKKSLDEFYKKIIGVKLEQKVISELLENIKDFDEYFYNLKKEDFIKIILGEE